MTISEIKHVKQRADIVEVISHFVQLKRNGANFIGSSPFSQERTPSFTVSPAKNIFKCFSSGNGGDVVDFVKHINNCGYEEAVQWIRNFYTLAPAEKEWEYIAPKELPTSYIPYRLVEQTLRSFRPNNFLTWLTDKFGADAANNAKSTYQIGTSKHWPGACIFWQCDTQDQYRSGKIMLYNPETGKRVKSPFNHITWVHKALKLNDFNLSSCLFGEHLIKDYPNKPIGIVESEKSAIVASIFYPQKLWIASGSLTNLSYKRCLPLTGKNITLVPDKGGETVWEEKTQQLAELIPGQWSIKPLKGELEKGYDLCDFIIDKL